MTNRIPAALREVIEATLSPSPAVPGMETFRELSHREIRADRARAMAAALRWVRRTMQEDADIDNLDDLAWTLKRTIAALEQESEGT